MTRDARPRPRAPGRARLAAVAAIAALAVAVAGCGQSSNTTSSGAAGSVAPTAPTTSTSSTSSTLTTTTTATTPGVGTRSGPLTASPASGSPHSVIHFAFVAPDTTGVQGNDQVSATLSVIGPQKAGCIGVHQQPLPSLPAGRPATVSVGPAQLGGEWCPGTYTARVEVLARPKCAPGMMCPQFIRVVASLGPATFRISG